MAKKWEHRRCERCRAEYRPTREAQSYCSPECRRQAAYGRERFKAGTKGRRKRCLEASDKLPGTLVARSFRKGVFSSIETLLCKATKPPIFSPKEPPRRNETEEDYDRIISRDGDLRLIDCRDGIQWIMQRRSGSEWRNKSFHRTRRSLVQRYGQLKMFSELPEQHDGYVEVFPRCKVCGRIKRKPTGGLPRHMFCLAERKKPHLLAEAA
jgi:hypothetical protein